LCAPNLGVLRITIIKLTLFVHPAKEAELNKNCQNKMPAIIQNNEYCHSKVVRAM
jgi:hypothetical protein